MHGIWPPIEPRTPSDGIIYLAIALGFGLGVVATLVAAGIWRLAA